MKDVKRELQSIAKALKSLTQKTEKMAKEIDKAKKAAAPKKARRKKRAATVPKKKPGRKPVQKTASEVILNIIGKSRKGVDAATLRAKTGFNSQKIRDNIYRLSKRGAIKSPRKGFYVKK
jgi:hypothetical protein